MLNYACTAVATSIARRRVSRWSACGAKVDRTSLKAEDIANMIEFVNRSKEDRQYVARAVLLGRGCTATSTSITWAKIMDCSDCNYEEV